MSKTYVGIKLQDLGLYNTLDPKDKIVIVKDKDEGVLQLKDFFLYVQSNLDLSNYYTSTQADTIFMAKVDAYTRKDADIKFALVEKTYTRTQSDTRFALAADTFNKAEIEGKYASKEQMYTKDLVYTKDEAITAFALKTEIPILPDLTPYSTTAKGDLRWALKVDVFSKTEADARFANINNYYTKSESDNKYALLSNTYTKAETDNKFLDTTEAYTKDYINLNIYTKTQVYTKAETDGKYPLKTDVYTVTAVNDQFAAKSWVYSRAEADNTFRKLADSYNRAEVNALIDASKSGLSTDVSNTYYTKTDADNKFELKGTAYNKIDSDAKYALISNSISPSQVASKYYNKTEVDRALGDAATNTTNLFALKSAAVGSISLTPSNLTFTKVDGTSSLVAIPTWNQSTTGNAATATKLQTARNIGITGAVTAAGISFDGSSNININATSVDASKLTGIVPNASLSGTYTNIALDFTNKAIYSTGIASDSLTAYGLASIRGNGTTSGNVMVIKTKLSFNSTNVINLNIKGLSDSETNTIDISISGWIPGNISKLSIGTKDYDIKKAKTPDGYLCFIMSHQSGFLGTSTAFSIVSAHINLGANPADLVGWSIYETNDISTLTNISPPCPQTTSVVNTYWNNIQGKPTTVSGYGITDAYTKADLYTKVESDNRFSFKQESIKSATLTTSTLTFTKADNTVNNIAIPSWNQDTSGNSATATKLKTPRTINGVSFDGSSNITTPAYTSLYSLEYRGIKPYQVTTAAMSTYFVDRGRMEIGEDTYNYSDLVVFNSWNDASGGNLNALLFGKSVGQGIWHYFTGQNSTTWGTAKQLAYTDSNITGNAASASKWLTARTFNITGDASWSASVDGSSDITGTLTLANTGVNPGTYTKVTVDGKGRTTAASNLVPADIPNLDMSKVNTGVLGISQGGTGATTAATARTNLGLGTSAVLNVGAVNGVASLDASGKVPTSQLYINNTLTSTDTTVPLTAAQGKVLNDSLGVTNSNLQTLTNRLDTNYYLKSDVFTKTEITNSYFDKTYVNNNFLAQAANKDVSIAGFINASKDILFTTSLTGIKWNMNTDMASISFKNNGDDDSDSYLGFDVGDNGDEYFRWSFSASSSNKIAMSLRRDKLEINNNVATLGLSTSATLTDISKIPQYGIYSKGNIKTDGQIITNATSHHVNISDLSTGADSPIRIPDYLIPMGQTGYIPFLHGSVRTITNGYTMQSSLGLYRANDTWYDGGMYMAIGGDDRYPTVAFRFKLDGTIDFTGGGVSLAGNASSATKLQTARTISLTGDGSWSTSFDGTGNSTGSFVLSNSGVTAGTYTKITVDSKGRATGGTSLVATDIPALDTSKLTSGVLPFARGGTGAVDAAGVRNNLGLTAAATTPITTDVYTGTVGNVMRIGDFGIGTDTLQQKKAGSYNDLTKTGFYTINVADNAPPVPTAGDGTWLNGIVLSHRSNYTTQLFSQFTNNGDIPYTYLRTQYNGTWNKWYRLAIEGIDASFTSLQMTRPSSHISAPNVFIDTDGVLKKTSFAFGSAATKNVGTSDGDLMAVGSFGWGSSVSPLYGEDVKSSQIASGFFRYKNDTVNRPPKTGQYDTFGLRFPRHQMGYGGSLWLPYAVSDNKQIVYEANYGDQSVYHYIYTDQNTPNADVTVNSLTVKNLTGATDNAPNLYYHTDGKLYKANQPALLKSQADTYYSPINLTKLYAPDTRSTGHVKPNTMPVKALSVAFADINASFGINNGYPWGDVIVLNTWEEPSGGNPNAIITSRGGQQGIWHAYGPFNGSSWSSIKQIAYTDSNISGNAASATKFQTARTINGVAFDGTANITVADNTKLPTTGGTLTDNVVFTNTDTGIKWNMNTDFAHIYFRNTGDLDPDSYLMFSVGDNGDEYFRWGNTQNSLLMSLKQGNLWVKDSITTNNITATNNITTNKSFIGNLTLSDGNSVIRDVGNTGSVYYGLVNGGYTDDKEGYMVIQTNLSKDNNGMYGIDIDVYQSYGGAGGKIYLQFYRYGGWYGAYYTMEGNMDFPVRLGVINDKIAIILGTAYWANAQITVSKVSAHYSYNETHMRGWTVSLITDISGYSETGKITHATNVIKADWNRLSNKPTTVAGYGITDVYTKSQTYTQADCDYLYFRKSQTWNRDDLDYRFINADGDTLRGNLHFYGGGWNNVGDDAAFGDVNLSGLIGIRSLNNADRVGFALYNTNNVFVNELSYYGGGFHSSAGFTAPYLSVNNGSGGRGISLHEMQYSGMPNYGLCFSEISTFGGHGDVSADWATYFNVIGGANRGWIFTNGGNNGHVASISARGHAHFSYIHSHGSMYSASEFATGSYIYAGGYVNTDRLLNRSGTHWSDNRHNFYAHSSGSAQGISIANLLVSDDYGQVGNVPSNGIWAKGDIKSALSVYAGANVYVGNNVQFSTTGTGINWNMNTDFARIYFKNDGNADANSYLAFEVGDDNDEHFKWFISGAENMALKPQGLTVKTGLGVASDVSVAASKIPTLGIYSQGNVFTDSSLVGYRIGVTNTSSSSGQGISLHGGPVDGVPSYGLMFAGTSTFGTHGGVSGDWATYFTMTDGAQRGWIFRNLDYGNIASISSLGIATFAGTVTANGVSTTDIVISSTANIASGTVTGNFTVPDQSIISADGLAINTRTANTKIRYALDYSPATAAAWINFSYMYDSNAGTNVLTVKSSYNISNITRTAVGVYKVEFLRGFEDEHYVMAGYARDDDAGGDVILGQRLSQLFTKTSAVFSIVSGTASSMPTSPVCTVLFFGKRYGSAWLL